MTFLRDAGRPQAHARHAAARAPPTSRACWATRRRTPSVQVAIIVLASRFAFDLGWPKNWLDLAVFTILGVACFASLGVAFSHVIPNFEAAPAYTNIVFLPVIFISGVFYDVDNVPAFLRDIADALPLVARHQRLPGRASSPAPGSTTCSPTSPCSCCGPALGVWGAIRGFRWDSRLGDRPGTGRRALAPSTGTCASGPAAQSSRSSPKTFTSSHALAVLVPVAQHALEREADAEQRARRALVRRVRVRARAGASRAPRRRGASSAPSTRGWRRCPRRRGRTTCRPCSARRGG